MQTDKRSLQTLALATLILFVIVEGIFIIRVFPKYQIPDEEQYIMNVRAYENGNRPFFDSPSNTGHPTLYEFIVFTVKKILGAKLFFYAARFMGLLFFALTLIVAFSISKLIFPGYELVQIIAVAAIALNPQLLLFVSSINSDSLLLLLFSASLLFLVKINLGKHSKLDYLLLTMTLVAGFLTKERFIIIIPFMFFAIVPLVIKKIRHGKELDFIKSAMNRLFISVCAVSTVAAFFLLFVPRYLKQEIDMASYASNFSVSGFFQIFKQFWWGYFGLLQYPWADWLYLVQGFLFLAAVVGLAVFFVRKRNAKVAINWIAMLAVGAIGIMFFVAFYQIKTSSGQARHIYIMVIPIYILFACGITTFAEMIKAKRFVLPAVLVLLLGANIYSVVWKTGWLIG